jgi:divalent metal cation (Fe/Co/Zn/Cd) transporter
MDASKTATGIPRGIVLERVSLAWMVIEGTVAVGAGLAAHSLALTAFGADSVLELVAGAAYDGWTHSGSHASRIGLALAVASGLVMPYLARAKKRVGAQIGSAALQADGACSMVCAYMAWMVVAGLIVQVVLGWWWLNAAAGLALVYFVASEGLESVRDARAGEGLARDQ